MYLMGLKINLPASVVEKMVTRNRHMVKVFEVDANNCNVLMLFKSPTESGGLDNVVMNFKQYVEVRHVDQEKRSVFFVNAIGTFDPDVVKLLDQSSEYFDLI